MAKQKKKANEQTVNINGKEYKVADLSQEQILNVNHCQDLSRKLETARFNVQQLEGGFNYFMSQLTESLGR